MTADCVRHAGMFFNRPDFDLAAAAPGSYALVRDDKMLINLEQDYRAMRDDIQRGSRFRGNHRVHRQP